MAYFANYYLPVMTSKLLNYPKVLPEQDKSVENDDQEKVNLLANEITA